MTALFAVRKYREADKEQCRSLWRELTEWHREIYQDSTIGGEHPEDHFDKHLAKIGADHLWIAVHDSRVVGLVGLILDGNEAQIEPLIVSKNYRSKGIGKRLVATAISEARKNGLKLLSVKPVARNEKAIHFLHTQGFRNIGHIELFLDFSNHAWKSGVDIHGRKFNF
jgi:GNAT superfamily N-acetyltransferase